MLEFLLSWALCGLVVGIVARLLVPGRHPLGIVGTIILGVIGAFAGGFLDWLFTGSPGQPFSLAGDAWHGWLLSIIGAVVVLWIGGMLYRPGSVN
jgi:uncharacterized membrane protein YeaQ/YmgE (transglycosylase-associated protein family)